MKKTAGAKGVMQGNNLK